MAERNEPLLRRRLRSAERFNERAMARGLANENTPLSKSSASLVSVTRCDQRLAFTTDFRFLRFNATITTRLHCDIFCCSTVRPKPPTTRFRLSRFRDCPSDILSCPDFRPAVRRGQCSFQLKQLFTPIGLLVKKCFGYFNKLGGPLIILQVIM